MELWLLNLNSQVLLFILHVHRHRQNRGIRLNMTEKLFTGTLNHNQNKKKRGAAMVTCTTNKLNQRNLCMEIIVKTDLHRIILWLWINTLQFVSNGELSVGQVIN